MPGLPDALAMICYEAIFPNETPMRVGDTAHVGYILNLTDDAWFGRTAGPYQHFAAGAAARRSNSACRWCASPIPGFPR